MPINYPQNTTTLECISVNKRQTHKFHDSPPRVSKYNSYTQLLSICFLAACVGDKRSDYLATSNFYIVSKLRSIQRSGSEAFWMFSGCNFGYMEVWPWFWKMKVTILKAIQLVHCSVSSLPTAVPKVQETQPLHLAFPQWMFFCSPRQQMVLSTWLNTRYTFLSSCSFCHSLSIFNPARLFVLMVPDEFPRLIMHHVRKYFTCITFKFISF